MFDDKNLLDKDEGGVNSADLGRLGPVQSSLGSDFPEPDGRFMSQLKPSNKRASKKIKLNLE